MKRNTRSAFSLVEIMVVISIIGIISAIAVPRIFDSQRRAKEAALRSELQVLRGAVYVFYSDTGVYPANLNALTANTPPANGIAPDGTSRSIVPDTYRGPYIQTLRNDPVSRAAFRYTTTSPNVGRVNSSANGNDSNGNPYSGY